ncbi:MAG: dockerin type I repeat-containing protein [Acutalibacteraceae bacterium]|nr:dockerin type I repeat-containing protein [Acutalibacteraceae bacterium]
MLKNVKFVKWILPFIKYISIVFLVFLVLTFPCNMRVSAVNQWDINGVNDNTVLTCDHNGVYVLNFYNNNFTVNFIFQNYSESRSFKTIGNVKYATVNNGNIYVLSDNNGNIIINKYMYSSDSLYNYNFGNLKINSNYKFYVARDRVYFAENNDSSTFKCYSIFGEMLYSFNMRNVTDYRMDYGGDNLYIFSQDNIYSLNTSDNYQPSHILQTDVLFAGVFICDNVVFDSKGSIVDLDNRTLIKTNIVNDKINVGVINKYYFKYNNGNIYGYTLAGQSELLYKTGFKCKAQMLSYNESLYVLTEYGNLLTVGAEELSYPKTDNEQNSVDNKNDTNSPNNNSTYQNNNADNTQNNNGQQGGAEFSINGYYVDSMKNVIWNIPSGTTIANFKNNLTFDGYTLEFYNKENVKKTSGKLGTDFIMIVKNNDVEYKRYTISVTGDLTGEGSISSNDAKLLSRYIMEDTSLLNFTNAQYAAADVNGDGVINGVDILKIAKNNL